MNFETILTGLPVQPIVDYLKAHPGLWDEVTFRQDYPGSPQHDTRCIFLRWCPGNTVQDVFYQLEAVDCEHAKDLAPVIAPVLTPLLEKVIGPNWSADDVGRVMLTELKPEGVIDEHFDSGNYAERHDRFHVAIQSEDGNCFTVGGEGFHAVDGTAFWFNVKRNHRVQNQSQHARIHLIVDLKAPAYRAKRGMYFQQERSQDLWSEIQPLLVEHWREIAHYQDILLDPDVESYNYADSRGLLRCYTVRNGGRLIGYAIFKIGSLHYKGSKQAFQDVLFVLPEYRNKGTGFRLIRFCDRELKKEGMQVVYQHVKKAHNFGPLLVRLGYELVDLIYAKRLDKE